MVVDMTIGERIRYRRQELEMTQEELGKKVGLTKAAINKYEKGIVVNMKRDMIARFADALEMSPVWLLGLEDDQQKENAEEEHLLALFRTLNDEGRTFLLQTAEFAATKYIKKNTAVPNEVI